MESIKEIHIFSQNFLILDSKNKLWIMGKNKYRRTGFGSKNKDIYSPIYTVLN